MTEREAAMTSIREFQLRMNGYKEHQQVEWDRARWTAFSIFTPFVKNGPKTPKAWVRFPWEQPEVVKVVRIGTIQGNRLNDLYMDFMSTKNKIKS
jgi:hypothetical protein